LSEGIVPSGFRRSVLPPSESSLGDRAIGRVSRRDVELPVRPEPQPAPRVILRGRNPFEDHGALREPVLVVPVARHPHARPAGRVVGIRGVEVVRLRIIRGDRQSHQAALAPGLDVGKDRQRPPLERAVSHDADAPRPLRHQQSRRRREDHGPRHFQTVDEGLDAEGSAGLQPERPRCGCIERAPGAKRQGGGQGESPGASQRPILASGGETCARARPRPSAGGRRGPSPPGPSRRMCDRFLPG
jgi:hypothetical protein